MKRFVLAAFCVGALGGCASGLHRPVREVTATIGSDQVQRVRVTAHSFWFDPNRIVVHAGRPVELEVRNGGKLIPHNFTIADSAISVSENAWLGSGHVRFTPRTPGTYEFFCHVDHHAKKGMTGTLVVLP